MKPNKKESYPVAEQKRNTSKNRSILENYQSELIRDESEQFSGRFASETLIKKSSEVQNERIICQEKNYEKWASEDSKKIGVVVNKDFTIKFENNINVKNFDIFEINDIFLNRDNNSVTLKSPEQLKWVSLSDIWTGSFKNESLGFNLENQVLKLKKTLNLRSLGFRMYLNFILKGEASSMSVLLRSNKQIDNEEAILIQFIKEGTHFNQRLYVVVGKLNETLREFVFMKKCEIPIYDPKPDLIKSDFIEIKSTIVDFGNDKLKINIEVVENSGKLLKLKYCQMFIPYFEDFFLFILGTGEKTILRKMVCELFDRKEMDSDSNAGGFSLGKCNCKLF